VSITEALRRTLRGRQRADWRTLVAAYLADPLDYWGAGTPRHAEKLETKKRAVRRRDGLGDSEIIDAVVSMAAKRGRQRPPPVYVTGLGGSGSHWVAAMINDLGGLVAAGEVYFPQRLLDQLEDVDVAGQACAIDAIHLLHGWPRTTDVWAASIVNCAAGVQKLRRYKRWDPSAVGIYLVRDPRDQVLSVTFRKTGFRRYEAPDASDAEYLQRMARRNAASYEQSLAVSDDIDIRCRYEDLCEQPRPLLRQVLTALDRPVDDAVIERSAVTHDAATIRAGKGARISNLDEGGRARSWREISDPAQRRTLHMHLVDAIHGLGYPPGDCMGTPLPDHTLRARTLPGDGGAPGPLYQRVGGSWIPLDGTDDRAVGAGVPVMLRIGTGDLAALARYGGDSVQALCLAANAHVDDEAMRHLSGLTGLRTLDLARTPVTDAGLDHLRHLTQLQQLHLAATGTTPQGRARLTSRMPQLTIWV
jgi:hypothetical protein